MIALPDRFYLWKDAGTVPEPADPTFEIDAKPVLKPYLDESGILPEDISPQRFELIVAEWLNSVLRNGKFSNHRNNSSDWVISSGLSKAISGGCLKHEVAL